MPVSLEINEKIRGLMKELFLKREEELKEELDVVQTNLKRLSDSETAITYPPGYNPNWVWQQKVRFILDDMIMATSTDIVNEFLKIEPNYDRKKAMASISATLSTHSKEGGGFKKKLNEKGENEYWTVPFAIAAPETRSEYLRKMLTDPNFEETDLDEKSYM